MVNRFSQPTEVEYISQYTPIPFDQLYRLGKEYNDRVDRANQQLYNQIQKWSEFKSPSAVDTKRWRELTDATPLVNKLVSNPDLIKTASGRQEIQQFIASRPYDQLSMLQQSRDAMLQRQKLEQELSSRGLYNPLWHEMDYTNYDTLNNNIFNDLSLIPYKSEVDLVKPYVDNLKSSYLYTKDGYDYSGVSTDTTDDMVEENLSAIYNTPEAQMHIKALIKQGYTPRDAKDMFKDRVYRAGREFAYKNREANPFSLAFAKKGDSGNSNSGGPFYLTQSIETTGLMNYLNGRMKALTNNPNYARLYNDLKSSDETVRNNAQKELENLKNYTPTQLFRNIFNKYGDTNKEGYTTLNQIQLQQGVNEIMNDFSIPVQAGPLQELLSSTINGISTENQTTPLGKRKVINGGQNMNLMSRIIPSIAGFYTKEPENAKGSRNKVLNNLKAGNFTNMILLSNGRILSVPTLKDGKPSTLNVQEVKVAISDEDVKRLGLTDADMKKANAKEFNSNESSTATTTLSGDYSEESNNFEKITKSSTTRQNKKYWELTLGNEIPTQGVSAEYLNQAALKSNIGSTGYTPEYPNVQNQAFSDF